MNKIVLSLLLLPLTVSAQQKTLRQQNYEKEITSSQQEIEWEREIYREIDLYDYRNAGLYDSPAQNRQGLFNILFNLAITKKIPVYDYRIDGGITTTRKHRGEIEDILINHNILYFTKNDSIFVEDDDNPAEEVTAYYIKEKIIYNKTNADFKNIITAICPIIVKENGIENIEKFPLFWVNYEDIKPYLEDVTIAPNYRNLAYRIPINDYLSLRMYKGRIYKDGTAFYRRPSNISNVDSLITEDHNRVTQEINHVKKITYNTFADSVINALPKTSWRIIRKKK